MKITKKVQKEQEMELMGHLLNWLELYTWIQVDGSIDFSMPRCRPEGLAIDKRELEGN